MPQCFQKSFWWKNHNNFQSNYHWTSIILFISEDLTAKDYQDHVKFQGKQSKLFQYQKVFEY